MINGRDLAIAISTGVLAFALPMGAASGPARTSGYFPLEFRKPSILCPIFTRRPIMTSHEDEWYSGTLSAAAEPSLYAYSRQRHPSGVRAYRLIILPSFDKPVIVRLNRRASGEIDLIAKRLSGAGGYDPGQLEKAGVVRRTLTPNEARQFQAMLARAGKLNRRPVTCTMGLDGSEWILESADGGTYRYVNRWSPERGDERALGEFMLGLAGWRPPRGY
ncbi:hypothetical protein G5B46_10300 [Caulobacter sp. 602-2]|uniref:Uncharacterized protein n=1 Tax=Caulobacter sp. 602-2 TaxID=2710887 RepID=A0A6G4QX09_9CAUL|nr:hypothetical protein [Caulobacter sp. 602-2]NGM49997.1 hypothetical protein [Caulobacter sp. 602-2]